jgi:hypothetical protein
MDKCRGDLFYEEKLESIIIIIIIILLQFGWHPVAAVQYTFTHKQYTEYRGRNTYNNYKGEKLKGKKNNYKESFLKFYASFFE